MREPLVSICIPTYNVEATIGASLQSILRQTYRNIEVVVSDNASTDGTVAVVEALGDPRVRVHVNPINIGGMPNAEQCFYLGRGAYTAIFHGDDVYEPDIVAREVALLEAHPDVGAVFTRSRFIDAAGFPQGLSLLPPALEAAREPTLLDFETAFKLLLRHGNFIVCPSVMARTAVYRDDIQRWNAEQFGSSADLDIWLRILRRHRLACIPEPLVRYRCSPLSFSVHYNRLRTAPADYLRVFEHYLGQADVRSFVTAEDLRGYRRLACKDAVIRANNALLLGDRRLAGEILRPHWSRDLVAAALESARGRRVLAAMLAVGAGARAPRLMRPLLRTIARRAG